MSQSYYSQQVKRIQGSPMRVGPKKLWAAIASYAVLVLGWFVLVAPLVEKQKDISVLKAAGYGMVYGLAVYGVFNFTNYVMFQNYSLELVIRDTMWGVGWLTTFTILYHLFFEKIQKQ